MKITYLIIIALMTLTTGCANKTTYHWGKYSDTLYAFTKEPTNASKSEHIAELTHIIEYAETKKKLVPPGINFELAMLLAEDGNKKGAKKYFNKEKMLFPESEKYVALALKEMEVL